MATQNPTLLEGARELRAKAAHVRDLCVGLTDINAAEIMGQYAQLLDHQAAKLEFEAAKVAGAAAVARLIDAAAPMRTLDRELSWNEGEAAAHPH